MGSCLRYILTHQPGNWAQLLLKMGSQWPFSAANYLCSPQTKYSVTEQELLSIAECLKEFKGMLWGQKVKVYADHKN